MLRPPRRIGGVTVRAAVLLGGPGGRSSCRRSSSPSRRSARRSSAFHACGVCHTDLYTASGADPTGYVVRPRPRGRRRRRAVRPRRRSWHPATTSSLFAPECGECIHCRDHRTNRCIAGRDQQGVGLLPDGTTRFARKRRGAAAALRRTSTFAEYTVMPEIALAKVDPEAPLGAAAHRSRAGSRRGSAPLSTPRTSHRDRRASSSAAASSGSAR